MRRLLLISLAVLVFLGLSLAISVLVVSRITKNRLTDALPSACQSLCQPQVAASGKLEVVFWQKPVQDQVVQPTISWRTTAGWQTQTIGTTTTPSQLLVRVSGSEAVVVWKQGPDLEAAWYRDGWSPPQIIHRGSAATPALSLSSGTAYVTWTDGSRVGLAVSSSTSWKESVFVSHGSPYGLSLASSNAKAVVSWLTIKNGHIASIEGRVLPSGRGLSLRQAGVLDFARLPLSGFYKGAPTIVWGAKQGTTWVPRGQILHKDWQEAPADVGRLVSDWPLWGGWWAAYRGLATYPNGIGSSSVIIPGSETSSATGRIIVSNRQAVAAWVTKTGFVCSLLRESGWSVPSSPPLPTGVSALALAPIGPGQLLAVWAGRKGPEFAELSGSLWSKASKLPS